MANLTSINALVDIYVTKDLDSFLIPSLEWLQRMKTSGNTAVTYEYAAINILNFWRVWSTDHPNLSLWNRVFPSRII